MNDSSSGQSCSTGKTFAEVQAEIEGNPILIANRGIPARRISRSISEQLEAVAIMTATDVDKTSPSTLGAHELMLLGDDPNAYLDLDRIVRKARERGIIGIHPGWGFGAEDDTFPAKCLQAGITFIGPPAEAMKILGNKVSVRRLARELGVPVVPGSEDAVTIPEARKIAAKIGFPIMLKAEGGGGGRGIYEVYSESDLESAFHKASVMAEASFGNPRVYVEKYLPSVRHIEIQVIADQYGSVFAFDERDCTVQRNHQKLVEITPSPWSKMTPELRERLKDYSRRLVSAVGYYSLATVEFLVDEKADPYLIEVNTRLQVEHGITECRYGIDLVEEQIAVAFGAGLRFSDQTTVPYLHAMQCRINCEDPQNDFAPNSGLLSRYVSPGGQGVRLDSCVTEGYEFPSQYDSAAALLITYGNSWGKAVKLMQRALREYMISGVKTTIPFHSQIVRHPVFVKGDYDTRFIEKHPELMFYSDIEPEALRISRLVAEISARGYNPFVELGQYRGRSDRRVGRFEAVLPAMDTRQNDGGRHVLSYPVRDRKSALDLVRDTRAQGIVHFTDTTTRDITQSNSGNRFRLAEDRLVGPYLDRCGFFSIENGGGAHFHVAMLANMTYPFYEARQWNDFAPDALKQILIRSTNVLGYKPQPRSLMQKTGEMICAHYDVIRCFDFLNHVENMRPFAEIVLSGNECIFEPAVSLSWAPGFTVGHYLEVTEQILEMCARAAGVDKNRAASMIILGLKDMAGVCPPRFMRELVGAIRQKYPELVLHYHRHYTDGLFVPAVGAAAEAGVHIVDTAIGAAVRWYGQGEVLSTAAYMEDELGLQTRLDRDMIRDCGFVLKQIMPYYDQYCSPHFRGIDYDVVEHGMPGGATSSSQEGAMKQGYIRLLPHMLRFLAGTRKIVRYHDVTPGSQITWNTAFLAVTGAYKRGGEHHVRHMLDVLEAVAEKPEQELSEQVKKDRLKLYQDSNDAFRDLLLGKYGRLPQGFPPDWIYQSAFGTEYRRALEQRTEVSPLESLEEIDIQAETLALRNRIKRTPSREELILYLNHPGDALKTFEFQKKYADPNILPIDVWFEGLEPRQDLEFADSQGKPHKMVILDISKPRRSGISIVRYLLDSEIITFEVQVQVPEGKAAGEAEMADTENPYQVASPSSGDLWVVYAQPGEVVKKGEELFNLSIMKQEKAVLAPDDGIVRRVLKTANYTEDKKMVPVGEGELIVELAPVPDFCRSCNAPVTSGDYQFCPYCGSAVEQTQQTGSKA
ncbi:MAG: pyruvate carboxylase [Desulfobacteraceae bacterium]|nr:pyruvate carboxylase [Desulfobacteraceae bacterium]